MVACTRAFLRWFVTRFAASVGQPNKCWFLIHAVSTVCQEPRRLVGPLSAAPMNHLAGFSITVAEREQGERVLRGWGTPPSPSTHNPLPRRGHTNLPKGLCSSMVCAEESISYWCCSQGECWRHVNGSCLGGKQAALVPLREAQNRGRGGERGTPHSVQRHQNLKKQCILFPPAPSKIVYFYILIFHA